MGENKKLTAKDFAIYKAKEIIEITDDLKYAQSKFLIRSGFEEINKLTKGILEHLEYLDLVVKE